MRTISTATGLTLEVDGIRADDVAELYQAFAAVVAAGEGYPQPPGPLSMEEFADYWMDHKSLVAVARRGGRLVGWC
jgi:hypothetical protein